LHYCRPDLSRPRQLQVIEAPPAEAYEHFRTLYLKYLTVYQKLERCFEGMIHPQKRADVGRVIDSLLVRLVQIHHLLVKWHPLNPEVATVSPGKPLPWEYVEFDDKLLAMHIQPEALDIPIPGTLAERLGAEHRKRDTLVSGYMQLKLGVDRVVAELDDSAVLDIPGLAFSAAEAIAIIQRAERGRQGKMRTAIWRERRLEEARAASAAGGGAGGPRGRRGIGLSASDMDSDEESGEEALDPDDAAVEIQRLARGFVARRQVARAREAELVFIGMRDAPRPHMSALEAGMAETVRLRRLDQASNREAYEAALADAKTSVLEEEGSGLRDRMKAERTRWFTGQLSKGVIPDDLAGYYAALEKAAGGAGAGEEEAAAGAGKDAKGGKGKGGKDAGKGGGKDAAKKDAGGKGGKDAGKGKGKGKAGDVEEVTDKPPPIAASTPLTQGLGALLRSYEGTWVGRDERSNVAQRHDAELARESVLPSVEAAVKEEVDATMNAELRNFKAQALGAGGDKKGKKEKKEKKKKPKKEKGKKGKALPGAKACGDMDNDRMLSELVEARLINSARPAATFASFMGGINLLGSKYALTDTPAQRHPVLGHWMPADPSMSQVREALMHYAVLPLTSAELRASVDAYCGAHALSGGKCPRSLLMYGPHGAGKSHLVHAVVNAVGALLINISVPAVEGKFTEKGGAAKLLHLAFEVAKDPALGPCVIYIDGVERMLPSGGGKKKAASGEGGPSRFKKDLGTYIKSLKPEHAVVVIGCSSEPGEGDAKALADCFDKFVYVPCPDYGTRVKAWSSALQSTLRGATAAGGAGAAAGAGESGAGRLGPAAAGAGAGAGAGFSSTSSALALLSSLPMLPAAAAVTSEAPAAVLDTVNVSALASVSNGYTIGSIFKAVRATITPRRLERLEVRPLSETELLAALARCPRVYADEVERLREFSDVVTGLKERRVPPSDDAGGKGKDKGKAKAKKK